MFPRNIMFIIIGVLIASLAVFFINNTVSIKENGATNGYLDKTSYQTITSFLKLVESNQVSYAELRLSDGRLKWMSKDQRLYAIDVFSSLAGDMDFLNKLKDHGVGLKIIPPSSFSFLNLLVLFLLGVTAIYVIFFIRQTKSGLNNQIGFTKARAKEISAVEKNKITFEDVAGCEKAKEEVKEVIEFLKEPEKFRKLGAKIPRGLLFIGPPGTGKTLLAKAVAGEAGVPFFSESGSAFVEMYVGVGAARVRDLFEKAKKKTPCVVFIDELDAIGRHRGAGIGGGHDEREQALNQILIEMDGFDSHETIIVFAATNRPDILDSALTRPGRFDRHIVIPRPNIKEREEILKIHTKSIILSANVNLAKIAKMTPGLVGADLANLANEAVLIAARMNKLKVEESDFEAAIDRLLMGISQNIIMNEKEKKVVAWHEAGHTLVAKSLPNADEINKVTIIPRGYSLGATHSLPEDDRHLYFEDYLKAEISIFLGGRIAEKMLGLGITNGARDDFKKAFELARKMIAEWGMSENLGTIFYEQGKSEVFLGRDIAQTKDYSEETARMIDQEVKILIDACYKNAKEILKRKSIILASLAEKLIEKETLEKDEINEIINRQS
ncbi:MAG: ATP-dependent zinc metalloprotease FtsH [Parcubacteria group bacterium]|nr:ATP-dependent zinc metalloprotease FtsH [Parcubacteria group bacterium]